MKVVVTVGLCVKNEEIEVGDAIQSLFDQDFPHEMMELIIVDGHSNDKTMEIIEKAIHKGDIDFKIFSENKGLGHARQIVVTSARGDYIIWLDGDLKFSKDYVRNQVEFMEKNPKVGIACGKYGFCPGSLVATLENLAYVVDSFRWANKELPRLPPTEGSIFRVSAIRQVTGFDNQIKGACEDIEAAYKIKKKGWLFYMTSAVFTETCEGTWKDLWDQYYWWGYGGHYVFHKDRRINPVYEMVPPAGFYAGLMRAFTSYRITLLKISFLLPIHGAFKRTAWFYGFIKSHLDGYGHNIH